jgi:polyisoprenoid-binding protein YceI
MAARSRSWLRWLIAGVAAVVGIAVAAPFVYIHFIEDDAPPPLTLPPPAATTTPSGATAPNTSSALTGTWTVANPSTVGYRAKEVLFGQDNDAAGRTHDVTGSVTFDGTTVTAADMTADLTTVKSDRSQRDQAFQGRIMDTAQFPNATFKLTTPIVLGKNPADGETITIDATGDLTLHGVTKSVTTPIKARRTGDLIELNGSIPIAWVDYQIPDPSFFGAKVQDHGTLEFLINLNRS